MKQKEQRMIAYFQLKEFLKARLKNENIFVFLQAIY